jgi:hypothetical protein
VAGGAGLASLAIQPLDGVERLHALYKATKNASQHVDEMVFDLKTVSLSLLELGRYQESDKVNSSLLDRCVVICHHKVGRINDLIGKMKKQYDKFHGIGRSTPPSRSQRSLRCLRTLTGQELHYCLHP